MLIPNTKNIQDFEKYGFKKCKGEYGKSNCYYLCVSRGVQMIFISPSYFAINDWKDNDPRIHKYPNCKYNDNRTALDILYNLIRDNMLIKQN